ncbi:MULTISPECIES: cytochrome c oxidase assembly protein [unclassified Hyphomonas]|jgi:cytochrome c oxidase assembly protein subunit 11|uniref:cytochrome c oxidase assembly protein n=1 Tax=unclassified Hyphomonas TaxID=2630699 RepID=UPI000C919844|nr:MULTISPECIES: cytochrome c oxidase assembly protein [unclassified Hyphomonas]MAL48018.1 cytochrome c oxidase assembly protein [Hyphomonas sp.]MBO6583756.1 cytochrome c oxidase assembly protein [Hyphomonas sp.]MDF1806524.1 cytochrome c oxidase assembly protein [Hyphomonas sp.]QSR22736.1 cytochrome c oxidase assembly protein [Hyphomonas sp. KY3]HAO37419.1 cytochrome c oxidase assembly protein [Hyphomonas sp.]|tara:strand:- start:20740 stop:21318 length:579 start_codon:yes stop_codon:yes gene_type:complete
MKLSNTKVALVSLGVFTGMLGLGFAADPLYDTFCKVTGFGGTTRIATAAPDRMVEQEVMVRFDANVADTPLTFHPLQTTQTLKLGQHGLAFYEVSNPTDQEIRVIASYNVTPHYAGLYFNKLECFCFEERVVAPGETKKLPIVYFVSADMLEDRVAKSLETITLSYTFFDSSSYSGEKKAAQKGAANSANAG